MIENIKVSLIISTYNWPEALVKSMESALYQSMLPHEIIVADDGSTSSTKIAIDKFKQTSPVAIVHIWHPDNGFRLSSIRNKAIVAAQNEYIIQIDGDIIMDSNFIEDHLRLSQQQAFLCGSRVLLSKKLSNTILQENGLVKLGILQRPLATILNSLRVPFLTKIMADRYKKNKPRALRGCNMSFWKKDLLEINGYNESIQGWGSEDAELAIRLINKGVKKRFIKFGAIAYHIFHKENSKANLAENEKILFKAIQEKTTWIANGIKP